MDPFLGDPQDPARALDDLDDDLDEPLTLAEREDVLGDLSDLEVFRELLEPRDVRGLVVDCRECEESHYFDWDLLHANLKHLVDLGRTRVHEPAYSPDPEHYVSWDYARGYSDAVCDHTHTHDDDED